MDNIHRGSGVCPHRLPTVAPGYKGEERTDSAPPFFVKLCTKYGADGVPVGRPLLCVEGVCHLQRCPLREMAYLQPTSDWVHGTRPHAPVHRRIDGP